MPTRNTTVALVLSTRDHKERDRWVTLLTPQFGKISGLAKGVRTLTSRRSSSLQPGALIRCGWYEKGETKILTEVIHEDRSQAADSSLERLRDLLAVLEISAHMALEGIEQEELYESAAALVSYVRSAENYNRAYVRQQLTQMMADQGFEASPDAPLDSVVALVEQALGRTVKSFAFYRV